MIKNYRIIVDGLYYTGEAEAELNTHTTDCWSNNSFQTKKQMRNVLAFAPTKFGYFKVISGFTNLISSLQKIIDFIRNTELMAGDEIVIQSEPYTVLDSDYEQTINELKQQLDIATDLGQKRFEELLTLRREKELLIENSERLAGELWWRTGRIPLFEKHEALMKQVKGGEK